MFFGNKITNQTLMGTVIALFGTYLYVEASKRFKVPKKNVESEVKEISKENDQKETDTFSTSSTATPSNA